MAGGRWSVVARTSRARPSMTGSPRAGGGVGDGSHICREETPAVSKSARSSRCELEAWSGEMLSIARPPSHSPANSERDSERKRHANYSPGHLGHT